MHRILAALALTAAALAGATQATAAPACIGDGVDGKRVHAVYASTENIDRYDGYKDVIASYAAEMDAAVQESARRTGGERNIRWYMPGCEFMVHRAAISPAAETDYWTMVSELSKQFPPGPTPAKYHVWVDTPTNVYCGVSVRFADDRPDTSVNEAENETTFARTDAQCWGHTTRGTNHMTELHELIHSLGAVQESAPHHYLGHCYDAWEAMCFSFTPSEQFPFTPCPQWDGWLLDCNHDDYFNTSPPDGSYLATHWNVANSGFLNAPAVEPPPPPPPVNQIPLVDAGPDLTTRQTATLNGTVSDDGLPNPPGTLTTTWSKVSGPGTVTFANPGAVDTTATFSKPGTYVLNSPHPTPPPSSCAASNQGFSRGDHDRRRTCPRTRW
jgi:hypothetical protein